MTPFEYLLSIDRQCIEHQGGIVQLESDVDFLHVLGFQVGTHKYVISIADISEVFNIGKYTLIPRSPSWVAGIANVRGDLVALIDMHDFVFSKAMSKECAGKYAILVRRDMHCYGLVIDAIIGMKSFRADQGKDTAPIGFEPDHIDHISAFYGAGQEWYAALSFDSLLADERFDRLHHLA